jgi:DNA repair exonuclease SbcCD nuclease subunit
MKVLVIGDTHFDNQFPGYLDAQHQTLEKIVKTSQPDAVIFLGDIFHHRNPDPEVLVKTWNMIKRLEDQDIEMVILRGNHDSANKADDGLTVLACFQSNMTRVIKYGEQYADGLYFLPHYEDERKIEAALENITSGIVFGHFGYEGCINAGGYFDFHIKKENFKTTTILGHIHQYKQEGKITILGTPWSTNFGECDYSHYVGELELNEETMVWSDLKRVEVNYGVRHYVCPYHSLETMKEEIMNPNYFTVLRVLIDKFSDDTTNDLRTKIKEDYKVGYVDLKFQPILNKKLDNRLSDYAPTEIIDSLSDDIIDKYLDEQTSTIPKEVLKKGLDEIKQHEDQENNG